ncbi:MAG: LysR family transcriptional regulator [Variibacter sp.]|nr:LysR family transcriptional regulator [Variibacter sp.]
MERRLDLERLRCFLAVADRLSFREAAQRLNIAQPAVSRAVKTLEAELGFKLLERTTRRVALTEAGAVLAREASEAFQRLQRAVRSAEQAAAGEAGEIMLAYSAQAAHGPMAEIVVQFRSAFPNARVSLYLMSSQEQLEAFETGTIDVGFLLSAACKRPLRHLVVARERFVVLVSKHDPLAARPSIALAELAQTPFVMGTPKRWLTFRSLIHSACLQSGFLPTVVEEADDVPVLLQLVSLRRGVTLYGAAIRSALPPDVTAIPLRDEHATFDISLAWNAMQDAPLVRRFIAFTRRFCEAGIEGRAADNTADRSDISS